MLSFIIAQATRKYYFYSRGW